MATFQDIQSKVSALQPSVATLAQNIQTYITNQQANGGGVDPTQLQGVSDEIDQIQATVTQANSLLGIPAPAATAEAPANPSAQS